MSIIPHRPYAGRGTGSAEGIDRGKDPQAKELTLHSRVYPDPMKMTPSNANDT